MQQMVSEVLHIKGMHCHHCVMTVRKLLKMLGVEEAEVDVGVAHISYDPDKITRQEIAMALSKLGYTVADEEQ